LWKKLWNFLWYPFHMPRKKNKIIQVPMPEDLVASLDRLSSEMGESRSWVIREAAAKYIASADEAEAVRRYIQSYEDDPEDEEWGMLAATLAAEVWPEEDWSEDYAADLERDAAR
jgi:metal-responsive CopG/Arc/MetJ family transcriptional regulator